MQPMLNLRHIHYFLAVAESRSISAAAEVLGMAQPSLSECVLRLEQHFQTQLAIRSARGIELTEAGQALAERGRRFLDMAETLTAEVRQIGGVPSGDLTVALPPSIGLILSVPLAETVLTELPSIRLHVAQGMSRHILTQIEDEYVHLGCVYETPDPARFVSLPLMSEELFLVTAPDNWSGEIGPDGRARDPMPLAQLADLPLVLPNNSHGARTIVERTARLEGVALNIVSQIDALPQIVEMVERASAYSILPHAAVINQIRAGSIAIVPVEGTPLRRTAYLVRKWARPMTRGSLQVQAMIVSILTEMIRRFDLAATCLADEVAAV